MLKHLTVAGALAIAALTATPALAGVDMEAIRQAKDKPALINALGMQQPALTGLGVMDENGKTVGVVNEVLTTREGTYFGLKVKLAKGNGSASKEVVVPFEMVEPVGDAFFLDMSSRDIHDLPRW